MRRERLLCLLLAVSIGGCGTPFYVTTEPRGADIYVDGKLVGRGAATVDTNGVVFNSYHVEARDAQGKVLDSADVGVRFGARSAALAAVGLFGVFLWPLLGVLPGALFVGDPSPERLFLHVPFEPPPPPPPPPAPAPPPDGIDRPVLEVEAPEQGEQVATTSTVTVKGVARHWSGVAGVRVELDGARVADVKPKRAAVEVAFSVPVTVDAPGNHVIRIVTKGVRGAEAAEEIRITRLVAGQPAPPPPGIVPGLSDQGK